MTVRDNSIQVTGPGLASSPVMHTMYDTITQMFTVHLHSKMQAGQEYSIQMAFLANLNDIMAGFYRSFYTDEAGNKKYLASTQFQATDARRAFPCFDEPNMKATYSVTLGRKKNGMLALSNMPVKQTVPHPDLPDYVWDVFEESVPMSTYLVAFVISDFVKNEAANAGDTKVAVWSRPGAESQTKYAVNITSDILTYLEEFFDIKYPLPKQDLIAIPDFSAGAMENWGLITYRETAVLYDSKISSAKNKQRVAVVIAHELAHQWFGDLVTTDWWDLLWLNEGFATYMEFKGVDHVEPSMEMNQQFLSEAVHYAMQMDGLNSSHPMIMPVNNPDEVDELFDPISYEKSGSVLRMTEDFLGLDVMKEGLTNYLRNKSYSTATADDLWMFLDAAAKSHSVDLGGHSVKEILDTWSLQKNFPVVTVKRGSNKPELLVSQQRFLSTPYENSEKYYWHIPLTFTQDFSEPVSLKRKWLPNTAAEVTFSDILTNPDSWVLCNYNVFGYYRVNYDAENWNLIKSQLNSDHRKIGIMNRAQIIDDTMNLASSGVIDYSLALDITLYLSKETDWLPWETADDNLGRLSNLLAGTEASSTLGEYIQSQVLPLYNSLTFDDNLNDPHLTQYLRTIAVSTACSTDYEPCVASAKANFDEWKVNPDNADLISPNLKSTITCTAVRRGDLEEFNILLARYNTTNVAAEKDQLLSAMLCTQDVILLRRLLEWSITAGSPIRKQDALFVYRGMAKNRIGKTLAFGFIEDKWEEIAEYNGNYFTATEWVKTISQYYNKQSELEALIAFKEKKQTQLGTTRTLDQAIEQTEANVKWVSKYYDTIKTWLDNRHKSNRSTA